MTRQETINAILKLLEKADFRQLRLVWVYASHLIGSATSHHAREAFTGFPLFFASIFRPYVPAAPSPPGSGLPAFQQNAF